MGYCMSQIGSRFRIRKKCLDSARDALIRFDREELRTEWTEWQRYGHGGIQNRSYPDTFEEALESLTGHAWHVETDGASGDVVGIWFDGDRFCDYDEQAFRFIAPWVDVDSYIAMIGEDNAVWAWCFDGQNCNTVSGSITIPLPSGKVEII